jgi:hypothetical protein
MIERYIAGARFYNFFVTMGTMYDNLVGLEFLVAQGAKIETVYLQIDLDLLLSDYRHPDNNLHIRYAPSVLGIPEFKYQLDYLNAFPLFNLRNKLRMNLDGNQPDHVTLDYSDTGCWHRDAKEQFAREHPEQYIALEPTFQKDFRYSSLRNTHLKQNVDDFARLVELCRQRSIRLIPFVAPLHPKVMNEIALEDYLESLDRIGSLCDFWDFSGYNGVTRNNRNFYEVVHYRPLVATWIAARIFGDVAMKVPDDFGDFVSQEKRGDFLQRRQREVSGYRRAAGREQAASLQH